MKRAMKPHNIDHEEREVLYHLLYGLDFGYL